jgi:predicted DNA-binding transcriptional regulator AlpA
MSLKRDPEAAAYIDMSPSWLQHSRVTGTGPKYLKIGNAVRYRTEDLDEWLAQQARTRVWEFDNNDTFEPIGAAADRLAGKLRGRS